jgi:hypothetical protein
MSIVVENLDVKPEAKPASPSVQQAPAPATASKPTPAEAEKTLRRTLERLARVHAS